MATQQKGSPNSIKNRIIEIIPIPDNRRNDAHIRGQQRLVAIPREDGAAGKRENEDVLFVAEEGRVLVVLLGKLVVTHAPPIKPDATRGGRLCVWERR